MTTVRVIAFEVTGRGSRVFDSINQACDYYNEITEGNKLQVEQLRRLLAGHGLWQYVEHGRSHQVVFDELL